MDSANNWVKVHFFRQKKVSYGEAVYVVGSVSTLGDWNPYKALKLTWREGDNWSGEVFLQAPCDFEYKYFTSCNDQFYMNYINWETGPNAKMSVFPREQHSGANSTDINIMSFNIRYDTPSDGHNAWHFRKDIVTNVIKVNGCDFVGVQEALFHQTTDLQHLLPTYSWYGRGREEGSEQGESVPIFYLNDKWEIEEASTFWLSDLPHWAGSKTYGNTIPRICTWARFRAKVGGLQVLVYNCHLDHINKQAQKKGAEQIKSHIAKNKGDVKVVILMGDLNVTPEDEVIKIMSENETPLKDTFPIKDKEKEKEKDDSKDKIGCGTFHQWTGNAGGVKIDYIFISEELKIKEFKVARDNFKNKYPSDHFPIVAKITL